MRVHSLCQNFLYLSLLIAVIILCANANDEKKIFEVVGIGECADCKENNFKTSHALKGLHVTIDCKLENGDVQRVGATDLDEDGNFKVSIPEEIVENEQNLKEECYAQLHNAAATPCPAHNGVDGSKIVFKSKSNNKFVFGPAQNLQFSTTLCTSKFLWPHFKYPPLPPHPWKKSFPKIPFPPLKSFSHPWFHKPYYYKPLPPPVPIYKPLPPPAPIYKPPVVKPLPPPVPVYKPKPKPKPPVYKPLPPPVPIYKPKPKPPVYKPKPPVYVKPLPPPAPIYKPPVYKPKPPVYVKPLPPPVPIYKPPVYKPKPPVYVKPLPPPVPIYKPPVYVKPLPPPITIPPFYKKPCPPLPQLPPFPKFPPKTFFHHPKFGHLPPFPPSYSHP